MNKEILILGIGLFFLGIIIESFFLGFDSTLAIITGIGTLLAGIGALYSINELQRQRRAIYQPNVIIRSPTKYWVYWENQKQYPFSFQFTQKWDGISPAKNLRRDIFIDLYNIGLGAANSIQVTWSFDAKNFSEIIRSTHDYPVNITNNVVTLGTLTGGDFTKSPPLLFSLDEEQKLINYILPIHVDPKPWIISIPRSYGYFLAIYSAYVANTRTKKDAIIHEIPVLNVKISYEDIGNERYEKIIPLYFQNWYDFRKDEQLGIHGSLEMVGNSSNILSSYDVEHTYIDD